MPIIYEPKGAAREYSPLAMNIYLSCPHKCLYCYAPSCIQKNREQYYSIPEPRKNIIENLRKELSKVRPKSQVLLSFIGDPYGMSTDSNYTTRRILEILLENKIPVAVLTKAGTKCLRDIEIFKLFGEHIQVGATLTFSKDEDSLKWESGAALPLDRITALTGLKENGIRTFASFEPVIEPEQSLELIKVGLPFIDVYKVGKINNYNGVDKKIDWTDFLIKALDILRPAGKQIYVKHALRTAAPSVRLFGNEVLPDEHNVT